MVKKYVWILVNILIWFNGVAFGQKTGPGLPQRTVTISVVQNLDFGQILLPSLSSGTVSVSYSGSRSVTGGVIEYPGDMQYHPAILTFRLCPGRSIKIFTPTSATLTDDATHAHSLPLTFTQIRIGNTLILNSGDSFTSNKGCDDLHYLELGASVSIPSSSPTGSYNGTFNITVAYE